MKPLTRLQQEAIKLRKIRLNQPPVTYEQAMKQFEEHRKAAQESRFRWIPENPHTEDQKQTPPGKLGVDTWRSQNCICPIGQSGQQKFL